MDRQRRSAKDVIIQLFGELKNRSNEFETPAKLKVIETIAYRMGWVTLYEQVKFYKPHREMRSTAQAELSGAGAIERDYKCTHDLAIDVAPYDPIYCDRCRPD